MNKNPQTPTLGIVTPSFNQAPFLEQTIDSVLSSKAKVPLAYAVIDGGSNDGSVEIIKKYEKHLDYWVSEPDRGQSHAINKGLRALNYDVWAYLNSDDYYVPGALEEVSSVFAYEGPLWITGIGRYFKNDGSVKDMKPIQDWTEADVLLGLAAAPIMVASQVSNFMSKKILDRFGFFSEHLHYTMDVEFGLRPILAGIRPRILPQVLGMARIHDDSKTVSKGEWAFPLEIAQTLRDLELGERPDLEGARKSALKLLSRRNSLNDFNQISALQKSPNKPSLLKHIARYPLDAFNREILGAIKRQLRSKHVR